MFSVEVLKNGDQCLHRPIYHSAFRVRTYELDNVRYVWGEPIGIDDCNFPIGTVDTSPTEE